MFKRKYKIYLLYIYLINEFMTDKYFDQIMERNFDIYFYVNSMIYLFYKGKWK